MEIIAHFIQNLNTLNSLIYYITTNLEPLTINNDVNPKLIDLVNKPDVSDLLNETNNKLSSINDMLKFLSSEVKKELYSKLSKPKDKVTPYANFIIDEPPIIGEPPIIDDTSDKKVQLTFDDIIASSNKPIKPIKRRVPLNYQGTCPVCGAPNEYIYSNIKGEKQYICKCCNNTFTVHPHYHDEISIRCPHCTHKLFLHHERSGYDVYVCPNDDCKFYLKNKKLVENQEGEHLKVNSLNYKLKYTYRDFSIKLDELKKDKKYNITSKIDLTNIRHSNYCLGLVLSYYVNYGLSSRKTAQILREIHDIDISHQTVRNYAEAAAVLTERINQNYKYDLSSTLTGDETYIKVKGKTEYVFFFSDTLKKIITSYRIFSKRDTTNAIKTIYESISKYDKLPDDLTLITDGNPIYNASQVFFKLNDINFDLHQVIGLSNKTEDSVTYRPFKQCEERLNRTYKQNYYGTNGYGSNRNANVYMSLYVSFFNFLRHHSTIGKVPIVLKEIAETKLMPDKWIKLLKIANGY